MSRLPNPFLQDSGQGQQQQRNPGSPGFLLMTRPPTGSNSYGGRRGNNRQSYPHHSTPGDPSSNFISFSPMCSKNGSFDNSLKRSGGGRGRYGRGGGGGDVSGCGRPYGFQGTPRFSHPYQQSPSRNNQSFTNTPRSRFGQNQGADKFGSAGGGRYNNGKAWRGRGDRGPISDIPIDKFISPSMVKDPWAEFDDFEDVKINSTEAPGSGSSPVVASLDDSEIIIDSDASVIVESTYDDGASGVEADSPAMPDTGSESPYVATSSTSEKDTGSDTASDG